MAADRARPGRGWGGGRDLRARPRRPLGQHRGGPGAGPDRARHRARRVPPLADQRGGDPCRPGPAGELADADRRRRGGGGRGGGRGAGRGRGARPVTPPGPPETQPERTALAWQRTGLGVLAVAGLVGHRAVEHRQPVLLVTAGIAALLGLGVLGGLAPVRYRHVQRRIAGGTGAAAPRLLLAVTATVVLAGVAAAIAVLTLP